MRSRFPCRWFVTVLVCAALSPLALGATTWHVGDGKADFQTIAEAVNAAASGDTIVVNPGTYSGRGNCDIELKGKAVTIRSVNSLDPNTVERTVIDCNGTPQELHRGFSFVDCEGVVLAGLTITYGLASRGGAIYCQDSTLDLRYCRIVDNATLPGGEGNLDGGSGGGLYCESSVVWIMGCLIQGNTTGSGTSSKDGRAGAGGDGAGICGVKSEIGVMSSTITENQAGAGGDNSQGAAGEGGSGGGLFGNSFRLSDCLVYLNAAGAGGKGAPSAAGGQGGGICAEAAVVDRCIFAANRAGDGGMPAAEVKTGGSSAGGAGGGMYCDSLEIANSLITGNRAGRGYVADVNAVESQGHGGGIQCAGGTIRQCTIADNVVYQARAGASEEVSLSDGSGAGLFCTPKTLVTGSILYGNTPDQLAGHDLRNVTYCNIKAAGESSGATAVPLAFLQEGAWVDGNDYATAVQPYDSNAVWVQGDYRLQATSSLFDAGDPNYRPEAGETDLSGHVRVADAAIDVGAFESPARVPLYRFQSPTPDKCFYTADEAEKDHVIQWYPDFWKYDGVASEVFSRATDPNLRPVYRFWSQQLLSHFYTINEAEKDWVIERYPGLWAYEGAVFYAYPDGNEPNGTIPVYRFWSDTLKGHSYITDGAEKDRRAKVSPQVWSYEGIAWYAYASSQSATGEPNAVYEFTGGASEAQCTLTLKAFLDGQEMKIDKPDVTFTIDAGLLQMDTDFTGMKTTIHELLVQGSLQAYRATIGGEEHGSTQIPIVLSGGVLFWGQSLRGPFAVDPNTLTFPATAAESLPGNERDERFTILGSVTVDGEDLDVTFDRGATRFTTGAPGAFDASVWPDLLNARLPGTFQWACQSETTGQPLLETKVEAGVLRLFVTSIQVQTTGVWQGKQRP